jgi:hypothetical protein
MHTSALRRNILKVKRILRDGERTTVAVDRLTHVLVKNYAKQHGLTVAEAVWRLLGKSLAENAGLELNYDDK